MKELEEIGYSVEEARKITKSSNEFKSLCYLIWKKYENNRQVLENIANLINTSTFDIRRGAESYKDESRLNYKDKNLAMKKKERYIANGYNLKLDKFMENILNIQGKEEIIRFFDDEKNRELCRGVSEMENYLINMYPFDYRDKIRIISDKIKIYKAYLLEKKAMLKKQKMDEDAIKYYHIIMEDDTLRTFSDIYTKFVFSSEKIAYYNNFWKEHEMYDDIVRHLNKNKEIYVKNNYYDDIERILPLVNSPIKVGNTTRKFDILDCYTYFRDNLGKIFNVLVNFFEYDKNEENKDIVEQVAILKNMLNPLIFSNEDVNYFNIFHNYGTIPENLEQIAIENIMNEKNNLFSNETEKLSEIDKKNIIQKMRENKIPITIKTFWLCINKYHDGILELITKDTIDNYLKRRKNK